MADDIVEDNMLRQFLRKSETMIRVVRGAKYVVALSKRRGIINKYLASNKIRKLQIGSGPTFLDGWLTSDIDCQPGHLYLDATKPFPFDSGMFDYIYSEHMIEHIPWRDGLFMLRECRRVLKPHGVIRIATPDLRVLLNLSSGGPSNERYIKWITDKFLNGLNVYKDSFVINNAFRNWGHQFLYDGELLEMTLTQAGFNKISRCSFGESNDVTLMGLESHGENVGTRDMAVFETMVFEAKGVALPVKTAA